jgi:putative endonuclease
MKIKLYYVYILTNKTRVVLYVGVASNLVKRVYQHKQDLVKGFTKKYRVHSLVYYEVFDNPQAAIAREKQIKSWSRKRKNQLIASKNSRLLDLYETLT